MTEAPTELIEVIVYPSGTVAEATSPEFALLAARTLLREEKTLNGIRGKSCYVRFFVDGQMVAEKQFV